MSTSNLQAVLDSGNLNNIADASGKLGIGTLLAYAIAKMGYTDTGTAVTSDVVILTAQPTANGLFKVVAATGTVTGSPTGVALTGGSGTAFPTIPPVQFATTMIKL